MKDKLVRMLWFNVVLSEFVGGKVFQVEGYYRVGIAMNGSGENMAIIQVGKIQSRSQRLYPQTKQSGTASFIKSLVLSNFSRVRSVRFSKRFEIHSSWILSVHFARKSPIADISIRMSRDGAGYRVQASKITVYRELLLITHSLLLRLGC